MWESGVQGKLLKNKLAWVALHFSTLDGFKVWNVNKTRHFLYNHSWPNILVSVHWPTFPSILYVVMMVEGLTPLPCLVRHLIRQCTKAGNWSAAWCIANNCSKEIENGTQANNSYWDSLHNKEKEQCFCFVLCLTLVWVNFPVYKIHLLYPIDGVCVCP